MTNIVQNYPQQDHNTVVTVNWDTQQATISSTKFRDYEFNIYKPKDQTAFFRVRQTRGSLAANLEGQFSSLQKAIDSVVKYISSSKETQSAKNERLDKLRKERNAAESDSKGS